MVVFIRLLNIQIFFFGGGGVLEIPDIFFWGER